MHLACLLKPVCNMQIQRTVITAEIRDPCWSEWSTEGDKSPWTRVCPDSYQEFVWAGQTPVHGLFSPSVVSRNRTEPLSKELSKAIGLKCTIFKPHWWGI